MEKIAIENITAYINLVAAIILLLTTTRPTVKRKLARANNTATSEYSTAGLFILTLGFFLACIAFVLFLKKYYGYATIYYALYIITYYIFYLSRNRPLKNTEILWIVFLAFSLSLYFTAYTYHNILNLIGK